MGGRWTGANVAAVESELTEVRNLGTFWPGPTGRPRTSPVRKLSLPGTLPQASLGEPGRGEQHAHWR